MLMKYRLICILMCLGMFLSVNAQGNPGNDKEFINELESKTSKIQTITCKFTQTQSLSVLSNKMSKKGVFYYQRPEKILLSFNDGDYIKMKVDSNPMLRELKNILSACMTGEIMNSTKDFNHVLKKEELKYTIIMTPKKKRVASKIKEIMLEFDRRNMCLNKMRMTQPNGDYTLYEFLDKEFNKQIKQFDKQ